MGYSAGADVTAGQVLAVTGPDVLTPATRATAHAALGVAAEDTARGEVVRVEDGPVVTVRTSQRLTAGTLVTVDGTAGLTTQRRVADGSGSWRTVREVAPSTVGMVREWAPGIDHAGTLLGMALDDADVGDPVRVRWFR